MKKLKLNKVLSQNEMKKITQYKKGKISIGATHNIGEPVLPRIMVEFRKQYPEIEFDLYIKFVTAPIISLFASSFEIEIKSSK